MIWNKTSMAHDLAKRDGWECHYCHKPLISASKRWAIDRGMNPYNYPDEPVSAEGAEIDHVIPRSKGGTDDIDNLVLACRGCNFLKGAL